MRLWIAVFLIALAQAILFAQTARPGVGPSEGRCGGPRYLRILAPDGEPIWRAEEGAEAIDDYEDRIYETYGGDLNGDGIDDYILNLGACGNWGHCVHTIFLGCPDGKFSLAMDSDYVYEFEVEPSGGGAPILWELRRGAMAGRDDLGRVRWELRDGRFRSTDDYELLQLMRAWREPEQRRVLRRRLADGPEPFRKGHRILASGAGVEVYRASEDGRLGVLARIGDAWESIEETEAPSPTVEPTWVAVLANESDERQVIIEVLSSEGSARAIVLRLGPRTSWETLREYE